MVSYATMSILIQIRMPAFWRRNLPLGREFRAERQLHDPANSPLVHKTAVPVLTCCCTARPDRHGISLFNPIPIS
jgi:hypothetical protein